MVDTKNPPGLSVWEESLLDHLTEHMTTEAGLLGEYQRAAEEAHVDYVSYLFALILEDEARHHRLFGELANALRASVERTDGPQVPLITKAPDPDALLDVTERMLAAEKADARELKRLARHKNLRDMRGNSLWPLLVELMQHDTQKHQKILRFVRTRLREDRRSQT